MLIPLPVLRRLFQRSVLGIVLVEIICQKGIRLEDLRQIDIPLDVVVHAQQDCV